MAPKIRKPGKKLKYEGEVKVEYKTTSFRLPVSLLNELQSWADACTEDPKKSGSLNDLARQVLQWGLEHREDKK